MSSSNPGISDEDCSYKRTRRFFGCFTGGNKCATIRLMRLALFLGLALYASAQTPSHWAGCGASFADPGFSGWCAIAVPVVASQGLNSFSFYQFLPNGNRPPTVATNSGLSLLLRSWKIGTSTLQLHGIGAPGVAVTSTATTFSPAGGGIALWQSSKGWTAEVGAIENKVTGKPNWIAGVGLVW